MSLASTCWPTLIGGREVLDSEASPLTALASVLPAAAAWSEPAPAPGAAALGLRPSPVAFIKPGNSMTVPDAWNTASPSVGPAGADRRTVAVEPVASAIWQASVRCQISVYRRSWSPGSLEASSSGSWKREPAGRIHSWASCAPAVLVAYCLGSAERNLSPKW